MTEYLLDTNAAIAHMNADANLAQLFKATDEVFVSSIALGELFYGAEKSGKREANLLNVEIFAQKVAVLVCNVDSARWYGRVHKSLRDKGRPIPQNDMWIAVIAMQHDLTLVTKDAHFNNVDNLKIASW